MAAPLQASSSTPPNELGAFACVIDITPAPASVSAITALTIPEKYSRDH